MREVLVLFSETWYRLMHADNQGLPIAPGRPGDLEGVAATVVHAERTDAASTHPAVARRGPQPHRDGPRAARQPGDRTPLAPPLPCRRARRTGGPAALRSTYRSRPAHRRAHPVPDHRAGARRGNPLEHPVDGAPRQRHAVAGAAGLAGRRCQAASAQDVQAQPGPAVRREGHRRRRALPRPARQRAGALGRREDADPGARPARSRACR